MSNSGFKLLICFICLALISILFCSIFPDKKITAFAEKREQAKQRHIVISDKKGVEFFNNNLVLSGTDKDNGEKISAGASALDPALIEYDTATKRAKIRHIKYYNLFSSTIRFTDK